MSGKGSLPTGWSSTTLGQVRVDTSRTIDPSKAPSEYFELYSIPAFPSGRPEIVNGKTIGSTKQTLDVGTVVVAKINPRINRVWVVGNHSGHQQIGSSEWIPFFPVAGIDPHYLAYSMRQDAFRNYLAANVSGVGGSLMRVRPATVDPYPFVVAPQAEQHRIVDAIESYFTRLDDAVATLERVQRNLKRYRASVLKSAVEGRLVPTEAGLARAEGRDYEPASVLLERILAERRRRWEEAELAKMKAKGKVPQNDKWKARYEEPVVPDTVGLPELPDGWCWASVDQLTVDTLIGLVRNLESQSASGEGFPYLKMDQIGLDGMVRLDGSILVNASVDEVKRYSLTHDDILFNTRNSMELVGKSGLVRAPQPNTLFNNNIMRLRTAGCISSSFVAHQMCSPLFRIQVERVKRATTSVAAVYGKDLFPRAVALPPRAEQERIVDVVEAAFWSIRTMQEVIARCVMRSARLRQSILGWAFKGKLVDQDPSDDPAPRLLERIKAEREAADGQKRTTRGRRKARSTRA